MKLKELPGWESALDGARQVYDNVPEKVFELVGEKEARDGQTFISSANEVYMEACRTGLVRLRNGRPAQLNRCARCGSTEHPDGSPVQWKCRQCGAFVCRGCTLTIPDSVPTEYYEMTLCSKACWHAAGEPAE